MLTGRPNSVRDPLNKTVESTLLCYSARHLKPANLVKSYTARVTQVRRLKRCSCVITLL